MLIGARILFFREKIGLRRCSFFWIFMIFFHGYPMGSHGFPRVPHGFLWVPMGFLRVFYMVLPVFYKIFRIFMEFSENFKRPFNSPSLPPTPTVAQNF